jgi:4-hydroxybenzoate polyprenyltransferase
MGAHVVLSTLGVAIGIFLSWRCHILMAGSTLFTVSVIALWYYSTSFKYQFLTGNLVVSILTGMAPFMVALFELPLMISRYNNQLAQQQYDFGTTTADTVLLWTAAYGIAAFGLSLIREMVKDMEDVEGDKEYGCKTIPIVLGIKKAKLIAGAMILLFMAGIGYIMMHQHEANDKISFVYFLTLAQIPLLFILIRLFRAREKKDFRLLSMLVKIVMLTGICFMFILKFVILK